MTDIQYLGEVTSRSKSLSNILRKQYTNLSPKERTRLLKASRFALNDLKDLATIHANDDFWDKRYEKSYNTLVDDLRDRAVIEVDKITGDEGKLDTIKKEFRDAWKEVEKGTVELAEEANREIEKVYTSIEQESPDQYKPRVTKVGIEKGKETERRLTRLIEDAIPERDKDGNITKKGKSFDQIAKEVEKVLRKDVYPNDKLYFERRTKKGLTRYKADYTLYAENWTSDISSISDSKSTESYARSAKLFIYEIGGGITKNPICDPFSDPSNNLYSYDSRLVGLVFGGRAVRPNSEKPPYHVGCSKSVQVSSVNWQGNNSELIKERLAA